MATRKEIAPYPGLQLLRQLSDQRTRIFSLEEVRDLSLEVGIAPTYLRKTFHQLERAGWVTRLHKGLYALAGPMLSGSPLHEYEIATHLVSPAAISHYSAMNFHELTEQIPYVVYVLTTKTWSPRHKDGSAHGRYQIGDVFYQFVKVQPDRYFGIESVWFGDAKVSITNLERTFIDALMRPQYCGGFAEVMNALEENIGKINIALIVDYALKMDGATTKRVGWLLEKFGISSPLLDCLLSVQIAGYSPLDPTAARSGHCNNRWHIQENLVRGKK
jgi:predicted transcriptional regulator of viral defense system